MSAPQPLIGEAVEGERRNLWGWFTVFGIVGFMAVLSLGAYFSSPREALVAKSSAEEQLKMSVELTDTVNVKSVLASSAAKLKPFVSKDADAALLYAVVQTESKKDTAPAEIEVLKKSDKPIYKAAYEIYTSTTLKPDRAKELAAKFQGSRFVYRLVRVHALEKSGDRAARDALDAGSKGATLLAFGGLFLIAIFLGAFLLLGYGIMRSSGQIRPKGLPLQNLALYDADRLMLRCGQFFLLFVGIQFLAAFVLRGGIDKDYADIPVYLAIAFGIIFLSRVPADGKRIPFRAIGLSRENLGKHILWGIAGAIANVPVLIVLSLLSNALMKNLPPPEHPATVELQHANSIVLILKLVLTASVAAPFIEEIMFRGTFFPALASAMKSPLWAGVITSLCFAIIHPTGIPAWLPLAAIGGMSCLLSYQTKSLVPSMVMHAVHNLATLVAVLAFYR